MNSEAKFLPVFPKPVITSSAIDIMFKALTVFRISSKANAECIFIAAAPCTSGSYTNAAMSSFFANC